jgi:L-cysteine S-thiosulfotransferase
MKKTISLSRYIGFIYTITFLLGMVVNVQAQNVSEKAFSEMMQKSFRSQGIADIERLKQDETQKLCSNPELLLSKAGAKKAEQIQKTNLREIQQPSDGIYLGDWKSGEAIAQSGRGLTWSDSEKVTVGGGCYNCHEIDRKEISHGNLGPSLWNYGKNRGNSKELIVYTWNRISNSKAYNVCSNMPRFAHQKILNEQQIKDVMALLLDPNSPVNQ